ncbi:MAG: ATP-grasp domain-containing protein [Planctomycetaceae bacterium]|nr:ATP-grasp domain-containing protein [Planctomycetaceae bacterium]
MQVFISEYVCGGAWTEDQLPRSLEREGLAMLRAIVSDFARQPDCNVVTTLDRDRPSLGVEGVRERRVSSPEEEQDVFLELAASSDACLIIAPELGNVLTERCRAVESINGVQLLNPVSDVTHLCSDKLALARVLEHADIPTIETSEWGDRPDTEMSSGPVVVKPRFGAGSQGVRLFDTIEHAVKANLEGAKCNVDAMIVQPFIRGMAISAGVIFLPNGHDFEVLPIATQRLSTDGTFAYGGGTVPAEIGSHSAVRQLVERACLRLTGLWGYIGFDLILPAFHGDSPVIVEINPRLTTSYLGYRQLAKENLAARMLNDITWGEPIEWAPHHVEFTPDGDVQITTAGKHLAPTPHVTSS